MIKIKDKFNLLKKTVLDIILIQLVKLNPNHCYKQDWEEQYKKADKYQKEGKQYFEQANKKYEDSKSTWNLHYTTDLFYKFKSSDATYKKLLNDIMSDNQLEEVKRRYKLVIESNNEYIVKLGYHKSIDVDLSTCKRLIDDIEKLYTEHQTTDYVLLYDKLK